MSYLDNITLRKQKELQQRPRRNRLSDVLRDASFTVIAEIKRGSPSKGILAQIDSPISLAQHYIDGGAGAISVLTDREFYASINDLKLIAEDIPQIPIIRKDFIIDPIQIAEAAALGASTVLLIVKVLGNQTKRMIEIAASLGLEALVEVHDERELQVAIDAGAQIIGVNNRDLTTFATDLSVSERLAPLIPKGILKVSESSIHTATDIKRLQSYGYNAALIGESIVTADNPEQKIQELLS